LENFTIFAGDHNRAIGPMNFGRRGGFASLRRIASARLCDLVGPNAVAGHERLDGVGLGAEPS